MYSPHIWLLWKSMLWQNTFFWKIQDILVCHWHVHTSLTLPTKGCSLTNQAWSVAGIYRSDKSINPTLAKTSVIVFIKLPEIWWFSSGFCQFTRRGFGQGRVQKNLFLIVKHHRFAGQDEKDTNTTGHNHKPNIIFLLNNGNQCGMTCWCWKPKL